MRNVYSNSPSEPTPLLDSSEQMPNFNNVFHEVVPKMMRVPDDFHRMVNYIPDLRNVMMIGLDLFTVTGILIYLILKFRNDPPLTTSVSVAAAGTPSISSFIDSKDPSVIKAGVFVGNLKKTRVSREDLVGLFEGFGNVLGATLFEEHAFVQFSTQTEAELSVQTLNGYTWKGSELVVKILTLYSKNDAVDLSVTSSINDIKIENNTGGTYKIGSNKQKYLKNIAKARNSAITLKAGKRNNVKHSFNQSNFNQHTTNFIVCFSDSSKTLDL
uniref:RRM domain-containing protein n=1 Tax=Panagrolaimus davidi TaxID=227884 RepID=A0A914QWF4_9BILA